MAELHPRGKTWADAKSISSVTEDGASAPANTTAERVRSRNEVWDTGALDWVKMAQPGTGGGGGGGPATIADGADVAEGASADAAWSGSGAGTLVAILKAIYAKLAGTLAVSGPLTDTQLRASRVPVDASGVPVPITDNSGSLTVDAPVGTPVFVRLSDGSIALIGQKVMAGSLPVVLASDQTVIPISDNGGSLTIDASALPLPAGASTEATLLNIKTDVDKIPSLGQAVMAASAPVTLASDQSVISISATSLPLPAGAADATTLALILQEQSRIRRMLEELQLTVLPQLEEAIGGR